MSAFETPVSLLDADLRAERERAHIRQDHLTNALHTLLDCRLDSCTAGDRLIRIHCGIRDMPKKLCRQMPDQRKPCGATDQNHLIDLIQPELCIRQTFSHGDADPLKQILAFCLIFTQRKAAFSFFFVNYTTHHGSIAVGKTELTKLRLSADMPRHLFGKLFPHQSEFLSLLGKPHVDQHLSKILAAQIIISCDCTHLQNRSGELQNGHIKRSAAEIEDQHLGIILHLVEPIGDRGSSRLADDSLHL